MKLSEEGRKLLKSYEGLRLQAYEDTRGNLTIGYGHTKATGTFIFSTSTIITEEQANEILDMDIEVIGSQVNYYCNDVTLHQYQFDSLLSFAFQWGAGTLNVSSIMEHLRAGDKLGAADAFMDYTDNGAYTSRRESERENFILGYIFDEAIDTIINALKKVFSWFSSRMGKVTFSLTDRYGPNSYDCSSAVYYSLKSGELLPSTCGIGSTESLFNDLERNGWHLVSNSASFKAREGDVFIWGNRGSSYGAAGHTGIFTNASDVQHCNASSNGISIDNHYNIWVANGKPNIAIYRYTGKISGNKPSDSSNLISHKGIFYPIIQLPVSADTNPYSPNLAYYDPGMAIYYDSYIIINGYCWISYISYSGSRSYIAVGPDDGRKDTIWGYGFLDNVPGESTNTGGLMSHSGIFYPIIQLPVSADTNPNSANLAYYDPGSAIPYDSFTIINGYCWISYISYSGQRRYIAVGPDDGRKDTIWGYGFLDNVPGSIGGSTSGNLTTHYGTFYPLFQLPVSADTDPHSANLDYYEPGNAIYYDSYIIVNGYCWISYLTLNGNRRYVAVAPDDGRKDTVWGYGFLDNMPGEEGTLNTLVPCKGTFYPSISLPVSADTNPDSANLDYYDPGMAIAYDSYIISNGYYWISYLTSSGARRYVAITPNDYELDTIWGTGFRGKIIKV